MKIFKTIPFSILTTILFISACSTSKPNKSNQLNNYSPLSNELYDTIAYLDSIFSSAFTTRQLDKLRTLISDQLEFYHHLAGATKYNHDADAFKKTFENEPKLSREHV